MSFLNVLLIFKTDFFERLIRFTDKRSNDTRSIENGSNDNGSNDNGSNDNGSNNKGSRVVLRVKRQKVKMIKIFFDLKLATLLSILFMDLIC